MHRFHQSNRREELFAGRNLMPIVLSNIERSQVVGSHFAEIVKLRCDHERHLLNVGYPNALRQFSNQSNYVRRVPAQLAAPVFEHRQQDIERLLVRLDAYAVFA